MELKVDRQMDWKMRFIGHAALLAVAASFSGMALGGPQLLLITMPLGGVAIAFELARLRRDKLAAGMSSSRDIPSKRRRRAAVVGSCVALFAIGWVVEGIPSQAVHDRYWFLLVAPMMIAVVIGPVALLMLGWSYLPRRDEEVTASHH